MPELAAHLRGALSLEEAVAAARQATQRYAKRQFTWLRTQLPADYSSNEAAYRPLLAQYSESLESESFAIIRGFVLTG